MSYTKLITVKLKKQYIEKYKNIETFQYLSDGNKGELLKEIAPIVVMEDTDGAAKRFDNFIYGLILAKLENKTTFSYAKKQLCEIAYMLEKKRNIPAVKEKIDLIQEMKTDVFWESGNIFMLEKVREELRELMKFLEEDKNQKAPIIIRLVDPIIEKQEGIQLENSYDF